MRVTSAAGAPRPGLDTLQPSRRARRVRLPPGRTCV